MAFKRKVLACLWRCICRVARRYRRRSSRAASTSPPKKRRNPFRNSRARKISRSSRPSASCTASRRRRCRAAWRWMRRWPVFWSAPAWKWPAMTAPPSCCARAAARACPRGHRRGRCGPRAVRNHHRHRQPRHFRRRLFAHAGDRDFGQAVARHHADQSADGLNKLPIFQGSQIIGRPGDGQPEFFQQYAEPAQFRRPAHPGAAGRPPRHALQCRRLGGYRHPAANAGFAGGYRHRRRLGRLWLRRGDRRGELRPRQEVQRPEDRLQQRHLHLWRRHELSISAWRRGTDLFGGRGHFEAALEYRHRDPGQPVGPALWSAGQLSARWWAPAPPPIPSTAIPNGRRPNSSFGGVVQGCVPACPLAASTQFAANGVLAPFNPGIAGATDANGNPTAGTSNLNSGGDGAYSPYGQVFNGYHQGTAVRPLQLRPGRQCQLLSPGPGLGSL